MDTPLNSRREDERESFFFIFNRKKWEAKQEQKGIGLRPLCPATAHLSRVPHISGCSWEMESKLTLSFTQSPRSGVQGERMV